MSGINASNVKRNSKDFSFVDTLGSFINNYEFAEGFRDWQINSGPDTKKSYIWSVLSAIGDNYAETIYENVLNYLDNVSNVDLCKAKSLQSIVKMLGIDYQVVYDVGKMPVEIANLIDILSINRHYLMDNTTFASCFMSELSAFSEDAIISAKPIDDLSAFLSAKLNPYDLNSEQNPYGVSSILPASVVSSEVSTQEFYINDGIYYNFLTSLFLRVLNDNIYMKYADAEAGLSVGGDDVPIFEHISDQLLLKTNSSSYDTSPYDAEIRDLKIKYKLENFKQDEIADAIENGTDYIDRYNQYEQIVLKKEFEKREAPYQLKDAGVIDERKDLRYNLIRYSYYREKKVIEYFKFVEDTYNSLIMPEEIKQSIQRTEDTDISIYDKDENYFLVDQKKTKKLLYRDEQTGSYIVKKQYIITIAKLLADQVLEIADIRDQVKIQLRKSYLKGTFLLLSYVINEYLKYNIQKTYGSVFYDSDNVDLSTYIQRSLSSDDAVQLVEYYDQTQYYNISADEDDEVEGQMSSVYEKPIAIKNKDEVNSKFWDDLDSKIGINTMDLPLNEIDEFYRKSLKLNLRNVETSSNLVNFLSIIYEYGANTSFWDLSNDQFVCQVKSEDLSSREWLGDISATIQIEEKNRDEVSAMIDDMNLQIANGYQQMLSTVAWQVSNLTSFMSSYWTNTISSQNAEVKEGVFSTYDRYLDQNSKFQEELDDISNDFKVLSADPKYTLYLSGYNPKDFPPGLGKNDLSLLINQLCTFVYSCNGDNDNPDGLNGIAFANNVLRDRLSSEDDGLSGQYLSCQEELSNLIENYVKKVDAFKNYFTNSNSEITSQTQALASYLQSQSSTARNAILQHQQNHLNMLMSYKNEAESAIDRFYETSALFDAFKQQVFAKTNTTESSGSQTFEVWIDDIIIKNPDNGNPWTHEGAYIYWTGDLQDIPVSWDRINPADSIFRQLSAMNDRCNTEFYYQGDTRWVAPEFKAEGYPIPKTAYKNTTKKTWADAFSTETETTIRSNLLSLREKFIALKDLINVELRCLGFREITTECPTEENADRIGVSLIELFEKLLDNIVDLDENYVKKEQYVETDKYYSELASKLKIIDWVLSAEPDYGSGSQPSVTPPPSNNPWNIKAIDDYFHQIEQDFEKLKYDNSVYLSEYAETGAGRIIDQIQKLVDWMLKYDKDNQKHVIREASALMLTERQLFARHGIFMHSLEAQFVDGIDNDLHYVMAKVPFPTSHIDPLYIEHNIAAIDSWIFACKLAFDDGDDGRNVGKYQQGAIAIIANKVKALPQFIESCRLLGVFVSKHYRGNADEDIIYLLDAMRQTLEAAIRHIKHIEESAPSYEAQKEIFLKYSGMDIGYDPFYNYTNLTHSSYQIHPYLYNFVEKLNVLYPLVEAFFITFTKDYERELIEKGLDNLIGRYGNVINLWKYGMFDWSGYQSQYEYLASKEQPATIPDTFGFTGAFYPPALDQFLYDSQAFIQMVEDDVPESPYYKLKLPIEQCIHIGQQLQKYEGAIREIAQRQEGNNAQTPCLSNEYDIYKYTEDVYGNSWILFKSYQHIIREHQQNDTLEHRQLNPNWLSSIGEDGNTIWDYTPTYQEKKNAPGEVWFRLKNHPIAFPAFDMLVEDEDVTAFLSDSENRHEYIQAVDKYFSTVKFGNATPTGDWTTINDITRDCIARANKGPKNISHLRCFFDMELNPGRDSVLLVVPYQTGINHDGKIPGKRPPNTEQDLSMFQYANSSIIIGKIYFSANDQNFNDYKFSQYRNATNVEDVTNNVDNIQNPAPLVRVENDCRYVYDFVGFAKNGTRIFATFVKKNIESNAGKSYRDKKKSFARRNKQNSKVQMSVFVVSYNGHKLQKSQASIDLKYDILFKESNAGKLPDGQDIYKYANSLALTYDNKFLTIGYVSEEFQVKSGKRYSDDTSVVNFCEYTNAIDNRRELSTFGQNSRYPSDTAVLQTVDSQHINIYNSFDSFTSYVVLASFKFAKSTVIASDVKHYNLNTDLGYLPVFADLNGKTRLYLNSALSAKDSYSIELLGPENSDIDYTPVIIDQESDKYGRVTEDYREYNKVTAFSPEITFGIGEVTAKATFDLSDVFVDDNGKSTYADIAETGALTGYSYTFSNTSYSAVPVATGKLSVQNEVSNYYLSSEKYDLLSGQDIIGPNGVTYQGTIASNHIENISAIHFEVKYDEENVPIALDCNLYLRQANRDVEIRLPRNKFLLTVYAKNNLASYDYYHIMENPNHYIYEHKELSSQSVIYKDETRDIDFFGMASLSDYQTSTGKYPFRNFAGDVKAKDMSAMLEFKYSEDEPIDREFPELATEIIEDEVILMSNENQYIYFYALDGFDTTDKDAFFMEKYENGEYKKIKVNTSSRKYQEFYDKALTIETTYNVEDFGTDPESKDPKDHKYEIVQYFNYKNFTSPCYIDFKKQYKADGTADVPVAAFYPSTAKEISHTYLVLRPGQSGRLDLQFDYVEYAKLSPTDLGQTIVGKETRLVRTYYIMNVSDDKPKFIISKRPFAGNDEADWQVTNTNREEPTTEKITVTWQSDEGEFEKEGQLVENFYSGQYLTFTDRGLTDRTGMSTVVGWNVQQYDPGYYSLGETIQLSTSITCTASWEEQTKVYFVGFYLNDGTHLKQYDQWVQKGTDAIRPIPDPEPPNRNEAFDQWIPGYTNIQNDTSCIAHFASLVSVDFVADFDDGAPQQRFDHGEYIKGDSIVYPAKPTFRYYTAGNYDPPAPQNANATTAITCYYKANSFTDVNTGMVSFAYDGDPHGLTVTASLNNLPGARANVQYSANEGGPWGVSPIVKEVGESKRVWYKLSYDNYPDDINSQEITIGQGHTLTFYFKKGNGVDDSRKWTTAHNKLFTFPEDITGLYIGHTFTGWNPPRILDRPIVSDNSFTANYEITNYSCQFFNDDNTEWMKSDGSKAISHANYMESFSVPTQIDNANPKDPAYWVLNSWFDYHTGASVASELTHASRNLSAVAHYSRYIKLTIIAVCNGHNTTILNAKSCPYGVPIVQGVDYQLPAYPDYAFSNYDPPEYQWMPMTPDVGVNQLTVYANYGQKTLTATFYANWASPRTFLSTLTGPSGTNFPTTPYEVFNSERIGYQITSWNTISSGTGSQLGLSPFVLNATQDYYAQWQATPYTITYDVDGGTIRDTENKITSYSYGEYHKLPSVVIKDGYEFTTWRDQDGTDRSAISHEDYGNKNLTAQYRIFKSLVTYYDNMPCNVIYQVHAFGCEPTIQTTIAGVVVDTSMLTKGDSVVVINTRAGLNARIDISGVSDDCLLYISGVKQDGKSYTYVTVDGVVSQMQLFVIQKDHEFNPIRAKIHEDRFIYSPGTLIGGFKYNINWQSLYPNDTADEYHIDGYGRIALGHAGVIKDHRMHLSFAYQVNNGPLQYLTTGIKNGSNAHTGYYTTDIDGKETFNSAAEQDGIEKIGVKGLSGAITAFNVKDCTIDARSYPFDTTIRVGVILRDNSGDCAGIYFGRYNPDPGYKTRCKVQIVEE